MFSLLTSPNLNSRAEAGYRRSRKSAAIHEGRDYMHEVSLFEKNRY